MYRMGNDRFCDCKARRNSPEILASAEFFSPWDINLVAVFEERQGERAESLSKEMRVLVLLLLCLCLESVDSVHRIKMSSLETRGHLQKMKSMKVKPEFQSVSHVSVIVAHRKNLSRNTLKKRLIKL